MIDFYTATTPNGRKVSIALEELGAPYTLHNISLKAQEQKEPWFLAINPNGRVPAIVDRAEGDLAIFESGAILLYLAEKAGRLMPTDLKGRYTAMSWLMWQMGGLGPMQGQANVFFRYFPEQIPQAISRYQNETARLYGVMDGQLARTEFLAGDYSIADIACYPWIAQADWSGIDLEPFPNLRRWIAAMLAKPAVVRGMDIPHDPRTSLTEKLGAGQSIVVT